MAAEKQALGRRAGLEVRQGKRGVLGSSAYPCSDLDQPSPCAPLDVPITSLGAKHRDVACQMCWHEGTVRDLLVPHVSLLTVTHLLPQQPEQADSHGVQSPAKPSPVPSGLCQKHPHEQRFSVERGDTGRQGFLPAWPPQRVTEHLTGAGESVAAWAPIISSSKQQQAGTGAWCPCRVQSPPILCSTV